MPAVLAEKLHALINLIESADNLQDIAEMQIYQLDADGNEWKEKDVAVVYKVCFIPRIGACIAAEN